MRHNKINVCPEYSKESQITFSVVFLLYNNMTLKTGRLWTHADNIWLTRTPHSLTMRDNRSFVFVCKRKCEFRVLKRPTEIWLHVIPYDGGYVMRFWVLEKRGDGPLCLCPCFQERFSRCCCLLQQVKNLLEEVESLNEDVSKLHRAARAAQETHQQTLEDLRNEEEKVHTLSKAKLTLEQRVNEVSSDMFA